MEENSQVPVTEGAWHRAAPGRALPCQRRECDMREDEEIPIETAKLATDAWHRAKGGRMVEFAGYWMPLQYDGTLAEHIWNSENAGTFDVSHLVTWTFTGAKVDAALAKPDPGQ